MKTAVNNKYLYFSVRKMRLERYKDMTRLVLLRRALSCFSKYSIHARKVGISGLLSNRFYKFSIPCSKSLSPYALNIVYLSTDVTPTV